MILKISCNYSQNVIFITAWKIKKVSTAKEINKIDKIVLSIISII